MRPQASYMEIHEGYAIIGFDFKNKGAKYDCLFGEDPVTEIILGGVIHDIVEDFKNMRKNDEL